MADFSCSQVFSEWKKITELMVEFHDRYNQLPMAPAIRIKKRQPRLPFLLLK